MPYDVNRYPVEDITKFKPGDHVVLVLAKHKSVQVEHAYERDSDGFVVDLYMTLDGYGVIVSPWGG